MRAAIAALPIMMIAGAAMAQPARCSAPPRLPACLDRLGNTSDSQAVAYCRSEVNDYRSRMNRYLDCLTDEVDRGRRERDRAETRLDCFARGGSICP